MKLFIILTLLPLANVQAMSLNTTGTIVTLRDEIGPIIDLSERNANNKLHV